MVPILIGITAMIPIIFRINQRMYKLEQEMNKLKNQRHIS